MDNKARKRASQDPIIGQLASLAAIHPEVVVLWLYGSQAKGNAGPHSDWDLAVAFDPVKLPDTLDSLLERRLRPELLALDWQRALGLTEGNCRWWISIRPPFRWPLPSWMPIGCSFAAIRVDA